jgi:cell division protein FtsB
MTADMVTVFIVYRGEVHWASGVRTKNQVRLAHRGGLAFGCRLTLPVAGLAFSRAEAIAQRVAEIDDELADARAEIERLEQERAKMAALVEVGS